MKARITVLRKARYDDLIERYERPQTSPCDMREGDVFFTEGERPAGFCPDAWATLSPFVARLLNGETKLYGDWMKDPRSGLFSCNDGFRPVSFLLEIVE